MKKKLIIAIVLVFILSLTTVWALQTITVQATVGQFAIWINGREASKNGEANNVLPGGQPLTLVYNNVTYIPADVAEAFDVRMVPKDNALVFTDKVKTITPTPTPVPAPNTNPPASTIKPKAPTDDITEYVTNNTVNKFKKEDLALNKGGTVKFYVGTDDYDKFTAMYGAYQKSYLNMGNNIGKGDFHGKKVDYYYDWMIDVTTDFDTELVKQVMYAISVEGVVKPTMITNRGVTLEQKVSAMYKAYGDKCEEEIVHGENIELATFDYYFTTDDKKTGRLSFYAEGPKGSKKADWTITGLRLIVD